MAERHKLAALIADIHALPARGVFHVTGGGSLILSDLLCVPGASNTVLEASVPYSQAALEHLLGAVPDQACSADTARALAMCAFLRARELSTDDDCFGFAITASLASLERKKGEHRAHLAMQTRTSTHTWSLHLAKNRRKRDEEERLVADLALTQLGHVAGIPGVDPDSIPVTEHDELSIDAASADADVQALLLGERTTVGTGRPETIFPGAFNPLHDGHHRMAAHAARRTGTEVIFEISLQNVDKPPLNYHDINVRLSQFDRGANVWLTNAPTFIEKARTIGGVTFVVGTDTMIRIADPRYYRGVVARRDRTLEEFAELGCRFLVFGRVDGDRFVTLDDLELPAPLAALCDGVQQHEFRADVSSSEIRAGRR